MAIKNLGRIVGKSDYELWLDEGNTGSIEDFLASLVGKDGANGKDGLTTSITLNGETKGHMWNYKGSKTYDCSTTKSINLEMKKIEKVT